MRLIPLALVLLLAACATKLTFNEQLATGYGVVTSIDSTADQMLQAGKLTASQAKNIEVQAEAIKAALDIARTTYAANATNGGNQLATALTALNSLNAYLISLENQK